MYKIGTDIVKISRIEKSIKSQSFLNKVFTENERAYCKKAENNIGGNKIAKIDLCTACCGADFRLRSRLGGGKQGEAYR